MNTMMIIIEAIITSIAVLFYLKMHRKTLKTEKIKDQNQISALNVNISLEHQKSELEKEGVFNTSPIVVPDNPIPFGYKTAWLAIKTEDTHFVVNALNLKNTRPTNWSEGLDVTYKNFDHKIFVTPPVGGWTFAVGFAFGAFDHKEEINKKFLKSLNALAKKIPNFYHFGTHRVVEYHDWICVESGAIKRAYAYCGESGVTFVNIGEQTREEKELGFNFFNNSSKEAQEDEGYYERKDLTFPNEENVINIAGAWSMSTMELDKYPQSQTLGVIGEV